MADLAGRLLHTALLIFFSLAVARINTVARINVVVINLALDPTDGTTPYRPHPGRQNLPAGLATAMLPRRYWRRLPLRPPTWRLPPTPESDRDDGVALRAGRVQADCLTSRNVSGKRFLSKRSAAVDACVSPGREGGFVAGGH